MTKPPPAAPAPPAPSTRTHNMKRVVFVILLAFTLVMEVRKSNSPFLSKPLIDNGVVAVSDKQLETTRPTSGNASDKARGEGATIGTSITSAPSPIPPASTVPNPLPPSPAAAAAPTAVPAAAPAAAPADPKWVYLPDRPFVAPICCGRDDKEYLDHPPEDKCGPAPMPRDPLGIYQGRADYLAHTGGHGCRCRGAPWFWEVEEEPNAINGESSSNSSSSSKIASAFDPKIFCSLLGRSKMLFIGDSTIDQSAATTMNAVFNGGCQQQMYYAASDTLVGRNMGNLNRGKPWQKWVQNIDPKYVILSVGPHIGLKCPGKDKIIDMNYDPLCTDDSTFDEAFAEILAGILKMKKTHPNRVIIWKTQQPGGCTKEISSGTEIWARRNWDFVRSRDERAIKFLEKSGLPYLDLRPLYMRSDAHISSQTDDYDCLHYCSPGPLDIVPSLLQALMQNATQVVGNEKRALVEQKKVGGLR
jgi:hypothetical protein